MAQFARPVSDVAVGDWFTAPLYAKVGGVTPDDGTVIVGNGPAYCEIALGPVTAPQAGDVVLRVRVRKDPAAVAVVGLTVWLMEGAVARATRSIADLTTGLVTEAFTLTVGERAAVVDWSDLRVRLYHVVPQSDGVLYGADNITYGLDTVVYG